MNVILSTGRGKAEDYDRQPTCESGDHGPGKRAARQQTRLDQDLIGPYRDQRVPPRIEWCGAQ
jgi:hypothetical protein